MLGNGPSPLRSGPWHGAHATVFPGPFRHQRLAFRQAADRHIGGEGRARIAALEPDEIIGNFEDALAERLAFTALRRCPEQTGDVGFSAPCRSRPP